jgi:hypothetical protein
VPTDEAVLVGLILDGEAAGGATAGRAIAESATAEGATDVGATDGARPYLARHARDVGGFARGVGATRGGNFKVERVMNGNAGGLRAMAGTKEHCRRFRASDGESA